MQPAHNLGCAVNQAQDQGRTLLKVSCVLDLHSTTQVVNMLRATVLGKRCVVRSNRCLDWKRRCIWSEVYFIIIIISDGLFQSVYKVKEVKKKKYFTLYI
jgi:hypothetical protein